MQLYCKSLWIKASDKRINVKNLYCKHEVSLFLVMSANWNLAMSCSTVGHCPERCPWLVLVLPSEWLSTSMMLCIADAASAPRFEPCCRIKISLKSLLNIHATSLNILLIITLEHLGSLSHFCQNWVIHICILWQLIFTLCDFYILSTKYFMQKLWSSISQNCSENYNSNVAKCCGIKSNQCNVLNQTACK